MKLSYVLRSVKNSFSQRNLIVFLLYLLLSLSLPIPSPLIPTNVHAVKKPYYFSTIVPLSSDGFSTSISVLETINKDSVLAYGDKWLGGTPWINYSDYFALVFKNGTILEVNYKQPLDPGYDGSIFDIVHSSNGMVYWIEYAFDSMINMDHWRSVSLVAYKLFSGVEWRVSWTNTSDTFPTPATLTLSSDGVIVGETIYKKLSSEIFQAKVRLKKFSFDGKLLWETVLGKNNTYDEFCSDVTTTKDGDILVVGESWWKSRGLLDGVYCALLDGHDGSVKWEQRIFPPPKVILSMDYFVSVLPNGNILVAGTNTTITVFPESVDHGFFLELDLTTGQVLRRYVLPDLSKFRDAMVTPSGEVVGVGVEMSEGKAGAWFLDSDFVFQQALYWKNCSFFQGYSYSTRFLVARSIGEDGVVLGGVASRGVGETYIYRHSYVFWVERQAPPEGNGITNDLVFSIVLFFSLGLVAGVLVLVLGVIIEKRVRTHKSLL